MELADGKTTPEENQQYNGTFPMYVTHPSLLKSPLIDALVAPEDSPLRPCIDTSDAPCLAITADHPKVCLKAAYNALFEVEQDWVQQNPGNNLDGGIK